MRYPYQFQNSFENRRFNQYPQPFHRSFPGNYPPPVQQQSLQGMAASGLQGLSKTLNHVQRFANMLESAAPMIEKYKPVVKNLPMMFQMLKAMQSEPGDNYEQGSNVNYENKKRQKDDHVIKGDGISRPKLFLK